MINKNTVTTLLLIMILTLLSSCANSARLPENSESAQLFYYRFSMTEPNKCIEKEFWLSEEQQEEIYSKISKLKFSKTNHSIIHGAQGTSLDQTVIMFWNNGIGTDYYFYDGKIFYEYKDKTYAADDNISIISILRKWTAQQFPELNEENF